MAPTVNESIVSLLEDIVGKSKIENAIDKILASATNLIKLLPTTSVLLFQVLSPTFTDGGNCSTTNKYLTGFLLGLCGISCIISTFTDSYKAADGNLYYGLVTKNGMWTLNSQINKTVNLSSYKLKFVDFVHGPLSVLVFASVALMNSNVVNCYYSGATAKETELIKYLPLGVGAVCSAIFVAFPTTRHGIGYTAAS